MNEMNEKFDDRIESRIKESFNRDLQDLFEPAQGLDADFDTKILKMANNSFKRRIVHGWIRGAVAAGVAAAVLMIGFSIYFNNGDTIYAAGDIDRNGKVNIVDAMMLARHIEEKNDIRKQWDMDFDGNVDQADVDAIAYMSVKLPPRQGEI